VSSGALRACTAASTPHISIHCSALLPCSDLPLLASPEEVAAAYRRLRLPDRAAAPQAHREALQAFVVQWCGPAGGDLEEELYGPGGAALPPPPPGWLPGVADPGARAWAAHLHRTWAALARRAVPAVPLHPDRHTLLWLPRPFVVPGARFREAYYWDSLWTVRGLLASGLTALATDVALNLIHLAMKHGFVPNGSRSYYLNRSQPPVLAAVVAAVHAATGDAALLRAALPALLKEHAHWTAAPKQVEVRGADGQLHSLSRYWADWEQPRPESRREDEATAAAAGLGEASPALRGALYRELASAAESGWDFSSRWLREAGALHSARTTAVVPADLNALLHRAERAVAGFAEQLGDAAVARRFAALAERRLRAIAAVHWDGASGQWRDAVLLGGGAFERSRGAFASNWVPLWCGCAAEGSAQAAAAVASLRASGLVQAGGVAASLERSGQQWDWPNAWPPLQSMLAEGCRVYGGHQGAALAADLAQRYLRTARAAWEASGRMFEKFDATAVGAAGGGGEYEVVDGFGWSNGVALEMMERYGWPQEAV
jgi:alpha,alpha-trehalase